MEFTQTEMEYISLILENPASAGAFAGMIFNAWVEQELECGRIHELDELIKRAILIRRRLADIKNLGR